MRFAAWINGSAVAEDLGADAAGYGVWAWGMGAREFVGGEAGDLEEFTLLRILFFFFFFLGGREEQV